ncbi:MAG: hypothetical protein DRN21_01135 [Thermoplasmata archaeon]|nr:MAG: hypothetical protein DRN21_01135 [Thermoplasmata archaeon]
MNVLSWIIMMRGAGRFECLAARTATEAEDLESHGSVGVILRAFREGILTENRVVKLLQNLESESTLFITHPLIQQAIKAVKDYSKE